MFVFFFFSLFLFWNIFFGSLLTIPLYKLMCNLSYLETDFSIFPFYKESALFGCFIKHDYDVHFIDHTIVIHNDSFFEGTFFFYFFYSSSFFFYSFFFFHDLFFSFHYSNVFVVHLKFLSSVSNFVLLEFISLQQQLFIMAGESALVFFRLYNPTHFFINGLSLYYVFPFSVSIFLNKIQCFCFDIIQIYPFETLELPVIFYIDKSIFSDLFFSYTCIYLSYIFFLR